MSNREYAETDPAHALTGFSSNAGALGDPDDLWSHQPVIKAPKQSGDGKSFLDPIEAAPQRNLLWSDQNEPAADDFSQTEWSIADKNTPGTLGQKALDKGASAPKGNYFGSGRTAGSGAERGNSPWIKGGGPRGG